MEQIRIAKVRHLSSAEIAACGLFAALMAAGAYIKIAIPIGPFVVNFTLQIFVALLAGFLIGPRLGAFSVLIYLAVGLMGVPVFAAGGGPAYLLRPTFGFLLGFVFAAWITGWLSGLKSGMQPGWSVFSAFWGMMSYYVSGVLYFYLMTNYVLSGTRGVASVSWRTVLVAYFFSTVVGDFVLCVLAAALARRVRPAISYRL